MRYTSFMLEAKPGWVVDNVTSVRNEVAEWRGTTEAERWRLAELCAKDVMWAVRASSTPQRILDQVETPPESTRVALQRLRDAVGWAHEDS